MRSLSPWLLLACACAVLFFIRLGATPLIGLDEALYAGTAREMAASGNYVVPTYNGQPFFDKPPLAYWLQALCVRLLGVSSLAVRLPSALAATGLVLLTAVLGLRLYGRGAGLLAGMALATAVYTLPLARLCSLDQLFSLSITAALGGYLLAHLRIWPRWGYVLAWAATGVALLVKGPAGAVLIVGVIAAYGIIIRWGASGETGDTRGALWPHVLGLVLMLAVAAPWYVLVQRETGGAFLREFIIHQNLQRAMGEDFHHNMPFWFYLPIYLAGFFPWSVYVPLAWRRQVRLRPSSSAERACLFCALWTVAVVAVFSVSRSKLPSYIYPAYPPSALLVGLLWSKAIDAKSIESLHRASAAALVVAVVLGAALIAGPVFLPKPVPGLSAALVPMALFIGAGGACAWWMLRRGRAVAGFAALCGGMAGFMLTAAVVGMPIASRDTADKGAVVGKAIKALAREDDTVVAYSLSPRLDSLPFYAERRVVALWEPRELRKALRAGQPALVVAQREHLADLPAGGGPERKIGRYLFLRFGRAGR